MEAPAAKKARVGSPTRGLKAFRAEGPLYVITRPEDVPREPIEGLPTLVYWDICGLAQPIRYALTCAGVEFADVRIDAGDAASDAYKKTWFDAKPSLEMDFPNLPYLMYGDVRLAQSNAILRFLARKHRLYGPQDNQEHLVDLYLDQATDLDNSITGPSYRDLGALRSVVDALPDKLAAWEAVISKGGTLLSDEWGHHALTIADCKLFEVLRKIDIFDDKALPPGLKAYLAKCKATVLYNSFFQAKEESQPPRYLNNPHAKFRG